MRHLPNLICIGRILLVWPIVVGLSAGNYLLTLLLFGVAALSDGIDGYLAKRFGWTSQLGKFLDPLADKLLLVAVFVAASWMGVVPWWVAAAAIARDVMIGLGALLYRVWFGALHGQPSILSKINTAVQIVYLIVAILHAAAGVPSPALLQGLAIVTLTTTVSSGIGYLLQFARRAWWLPVDSRA
jgi:cardiolipin synthase